MAFLKRSPRSASIVGLDIDPSYIAAAVAHVNGTVTVDRAAVAPLRPGILRDGEVSDPRGLADALEELFAEHKLPKRVRLGVANQRIVVRTLDLPVLDEKALAAAVKVEAPDHIPMPMDEAVLDFQPLGVVDTPDGPRSRVVVVAVRREMVERLAEAARAAGLEVEGIDLSAFAMIRALGANEGPGGVLYVSVAGLTNVAVASSGHCLFTRAAAGGLDLLVSTLAERRGLTLEHAQQWLTHVGIETPLDEVAGDPELVSAARGVLEEGVHQLADTVRNSLNFYRTQASAEAVERAIITGPAVAIPGLPAALSDSLRMPVEVGVVTVGSADEVDPGRLSVAAGLSVASVG